MHINTESIDTSWLADGREATSNDLHSKFQSPIWKVSHTRVGATHTPGLVNPSRCTPSTTTCLKYQFVTFSHCCESSLVFIMDPLLSFHAYILYEWTYHIGLHMDDEQPETLSVMNPRIQSRKSGTSHTIWVFLCGQGLFFYHSLRATPSLFTCIIDGTQRRIWNGNSHREKSPLSKAHYWHCHLHTEHLCWGRIPLFLSGSYACQTVRYPFIQKHMGYSTPDSEMHALAVGFTVMFIVLNTRRLLRWCSRFCHFFRNVLERVNETHSWSRTS